MPPKVDLTGNVYGELTVIQMLYNYKNKHRTYCRCIGDNNEEVIVRADALQSGATVSTKGAGKTGKKFDITNQVFGLLTAIEPTDRRASNGSVVWKCKCKCGNITYVSVGQLTRHHTISCGCRHKSKWEMYISDILDSLHIEYIDQKRFPECMNMQKTDMLPFDFYLLDYNICIEYDGIHHFEPVSHWGGENKFIITQQNDKIKNKFCKDNNITLLRIPYTYTKEEVKNTILNILSPLTTTA